MFQLLSNVQNPQLKALLKRLMSSKMELVGVQDVPAHDMKIYPCVTWHRIQGKVDGKQAVVLVGLP